jgi:SAM-dependent methyltransferase
MQETAPDPSSKWDSRYADRLRRTVSDDTDPWLERWTALLETSRQGKILELGCGRGRDSHYLTDFGLDVVACDYSQEALEICRRNAPRAERLRIDISGPLPFPDEAFPVVLASLCLHYFSWPRTVAIMAEIRRCLKPGGFLLLRVNSTGDVHHGAVGHPEVEPGLYNVDGELKRFFDRNAVERLVGSDWMVHGLEEMTVDRYASPKVLWEVVLEKRRGSPYRTGVQVAERV